MLKLKNICKNYETQFTSVKALKKVSLNFRKSEFVSILGPSGCGKTTMLNVIGGLDHYTKGDLIINNVSTKKYTDRNWDSYRNHSIGFVFQSYNLIPHQTVLENVELALTLSGISKTERKKRTIEVLEKVGLSDKITARPNQLSGGQMQRVAIARALVNNPDILLADEPTGALDTETSVQILELLKEIAKEKLVIMVTHNPELANTYSNRIIRLKDGEIISDTNPFEGIVYEEKIEKANGKKKTKEKSSMSFKTALGLSARNLMTKKARSILVAFAGSIGIIGIALILSLSSGFQSYIDKVQEDTLSTYPLTIEETKLDITAIFQNIMGKTPDEKYEKEKDNIYTSTVLIEMFETLVSGRYSNNLADFKKYVEENEKLQENISDVKYSYNLDLQIFSANSIARNLQVNPSTLLEDILGDALEDILGDALEDILGDALEGNSGFMGNFEIFSEMLDNPELLKLQYELVNGSWPTKHNEVVLVVDKEYEINDYVLYALGVKDPKELEDLIKKIMLGEEVTIEKSKFSYEDLKKQIDLRLVLNTDYYTKESPTLWKDNSDDVVYMSDLIKNGLKLEVVGIIKPSETGVATSINGSIGYLSSLTEYVINEINKQEIVLNQKKYSEIDVFTGKAFEKITLNYEQLEQYMQTPAMEAYKAQYDALKIFYFEQYGEEKGKKNLISMFEGYLSSNNTYDNNIKKLGVNDLSNPSKISLYPIDFAAKNEIIEIIKDYNAKQIATGDESNVIKYTDYIGLLMSSISDVVNGITYVLIAFVAVSLVVSSIMIGIITYISVLERTKEIGILRSIGASKRDVSNVFNAETIIIGLVAGLIGVGITLVLNIPINIIIKALAGISNVSKLPFLYGTILVLISVFLSLIAGIIPSKLAAKKDPVEALRSE